jgi:hypothetical protein
MVKKDKPTTKYENQHSVFIKIINHKVTIEP